MEDEAGGRILMFSYPSVIESLGNPVNIVGGKALATLIGEFYRQLRADELIQSRLEPRENVEAAATLTESKP